jgi:NDP-sugar pyrophosphorylase family protein
MKLPVAILCGGKGTRVYPLTEERPKALIEIAGEPFIAHQLRLLSASGIERAVLCVGYQGESVLQYVGDGTQFGLRVEYSFDGPTLLGTAGAVRRALPILGQEFFVLYGDSYLPCQYQAIGQSFLVSGKQGLMTIFCNNSQWDSSNVEVSDSGLILAYNKAIRTPEMHHIDYGLGAFRASAFDDVPRDTVFDLADLYNQLLAEKDLASYEVNERFYEIGSFAGIHELAAFLSVQRTSR